MRAGIKVYSQRMDMKVEINVRPKACEVRYVHGYALPSSAIEGMKSKDKKFEEQDYDKERKQASRVLKLVEKSDGKSHSFRAASQIFHSDSCLRWYINTLPKAISL
jgi:hypothetical protein